ncbi:hypothetical protein SMC26_10090 [Actinomadura fulvescens]|uniref:Uncharacterized protein n=1 Tax=Actinomadura fulvescens TaxID=46160 RepID=A0ABN3Q1M7_9ACTN
MTVLLRPIDPPPILCALALVAALALRAPLPELPVYGVGAVFAAAALVRVFVSVRAAVRIEVQINRR